MANTVRFIRMEFRINERGKKGKQNWCDGKGGLKRLHCGVYKCTSECAFVLGFVQQGKH